MIGTTRKEWLKCFQLYLRTFFVHAANMRLDNFILAKLPIYFRLDAILSLSLGSGLYLLSFILTLLFPFKHTMSKVFTQICSSRKKNGFLALTVPKVSQSTIFLHNTKQQLCRTNRNDCLHQHHEKSDNSQNLKNSLPEGGGEGGGDSGGKRESFSIKINGKKKQP